MLRLLGAIGLGGVAALALALLAVGAVQPARAATALYPDLRSFAPRDLIFDTEQIDGQNRHVLRFTSTTWNAGQGPLELRGDSSSGQTIVYQRIYDDGGSFVELQVGTFVFHPSHDHWHFESFVEHELWSWSEFQRWEASGRTQGQPRWRAAKTTGQGSSVCMRDSRPIENLPGSPRFGIYNACGRDIQGISVGWGDTYDFLLPDQWIDLGASKLPRGKYVLRSLVDPLGLLHESPNKSNPSREGSASNEAVTLFSVRKKRPRTCNLDSLPPSAEARPSLSKALARSRC